MAIFLAALPAGGVFILLQRAIPPFAVSRAGQETSADLTRGIVVTIIGAAAVGILGKIGVWLASQTR